MSNTTNFINGLSDDEVWELYGKTIQELVDRKLIRTKNIVGERGEFLAIKWYKDTPGIPNLQSAPEGTQNVDAISRKGERYSIKTMTLPNRTTSVFYGLGNQNDDPPKNPKFEYVIIVLINSDFTLQSMYEITWDQFLHYRKWHSTMSGWNLTITKSLIEVSKVIYQQS